MAALGATYGYSESEEEAAQRTAFDLVIAAGYDPAAAAKVWQKADADFRKRHPGEAAPSLLQALARGAPARAFWKQGLENHATAIAAYRTRWVEDEVRQGDKVALFLSLSTDGSGLYCYGLGEAYRKRGLPGDAAFAEAAFRQALVAPDAPAIAWRGLGLAAMQAGDKVTARNAFAHYRAALPDADDKAMIDYYLAQQ